MAIIKHLSGKNADLSSPINYLTMQHDEKNGKPLLNENGEMMLRDEFLIAGMNISSPEAFQIECVELNKQYGKNRKKSDVKTHHFILSFDPRDCADHGLTMERAQRLGMEYAHKFLEGHQTIICTHPDGDNGSGNIHVHIVANSLKKYDVDKREWMEKRGEYAAGFKIRTSKSFMDASKEYVMEMCRREGLYQEELIAPAREKITDKEYRKQQREQEKLDKRNKEIEDAGLQPKKRNYYTKNRELRTAIRRTSFKAKTVEDFKRILWDEYKIEVTESRGKWGYKREGEQRTTRARRLGSEFEKEAVIFAIESVKEMIDIDGNSKAQSSRGYRRALELENIQRQAKTLSYLHEKGLESVDDLNKKIVAATDKANEAADEVKIISADIEKCNKLMAAQSAYFAHRKVYSGLKIAKNPKAYREANIAEITQYEAARRELKELLAGEKMPSMQAIKARKAELASRRDEKQRESQERKRDLAELRTIKRNLDTMLDVKQDLAKETEI